MKLNDKKVVDQKIAIQRKTQMDESAELTSKIEIARQDLLSLEKQREQYISGMKSQIEQETGESLKKLEEVKSEIKDLEERRVKLLEPVTKEWAEVREAKTEADKLLQSAREKMTKTLIQSKLVEKESVERSNQVTLREKRVIERELELNNKLLNN